MTLEKLNHKVLQRLRTGDLILFSTDNGWVDYFLKFFTWSEYTHIGMVIKEPSISFKKLDPDKIYIWESGMESYPNKVKLGVQITDLDTIIPNYKGKLYVRKLEGSDREIKRIFNPQSLSKIYEQANGKPYDCNIFDWLGAFCRTDIRPQKTNRFWCSAFVGYIYTQLYILSGNTDWSILRPSDFSIQDKDEHLNYQTITKLEPRQYLLLG